MDNPYRDYTPEQMILRDHLALDRTALASERTFLSYVRTALGLFSSGIACVKFILDSPLIYVAGMVMLVAAPIVFIYGLVRFTTIRDKLSVLTASGRTEPSSAAASKTEKQ